MKNAKGAGVVTVALAVFFSFISAITQQETAVAQMMIDQLCDSFCDVQQEPGEDLETDQTEEVISDRPEGSLPTIDEFIAVLNAEREFDDQRMAEEQQENGIYDARNIPTTAVFSDDAKTTLINQTFIKLLNNITESEESAAAEPAAPDIEEVEEEVDIDEIAQRQIISYEFDEEEGTVIDDIRIYTEPEETIQSLARTIATFTNKTNIDLYANGRMIITYAGGFSSDADDTRIYAPHNYTIVNGYTYVNNTIYDQNGIEVFADPNTT
jgi:hypothetical protein